MELHHASRQWATRPNDDRFVSLTDLHERCERSHAASTAKVVSSRKLEIQPVEADPMKGVQIVGQNGVPAFMTHWSFGQLAALAGGPAGYLRTLPAPIAADAMNYGLRFNREAEDVGVLLTKQEITPDPGSIGEALGDAGFVGHHIELRAATGPRYGRIWNKDITAALIGRFGDGTREGGGNWQVPGEFGQQVPITKDNTTIYGSDRDMFVFLADETHRLEIGNRRHGEPGQLSRGFFVWNSEVGAQSIGAAFFLFDYTCSNRIVWGAQQFKELRLRHTVSAPDRWLEEIQPVLIEYGNSAASTVEETIKAAQQAKIDDDLDKFLKNRFNAKQTAAIKAAHEREEGRPIETIWDAVTGVTALAKGIKWQDERVALEREGGKLLDLVAA